MYLAEKEANPEKFSNFADALWWGVVCRRRRRNSKALLPIKKRGETKRAAERDEGGLISLRLCRVVCR